MRFGRADYTFKLGGYRFGFTDMTYSGIPPIPSRDYTEAYLGPIGPFQVPFSAKQGCVIAMAAPLLLAILTAAIFWRRKMIKSARNA